MAEVNNIVDSTALKAYHNHLKTNGKKTFVPKDISTGYTMSGTGTLEMPFGIKAGKALETDSNGTSNPLVINSDGEIKLRPDYFSIETPNAEKAQIILSQRSEGSGPNKTYGWDIEALKATVDNDNFTTWSVDMNGKTYGFTVDTAAKGTDDETLANTAFVQKAVSDYLPLDGGIMTGAVGFKGTDNIIETSELGGGPVLAIGHDSNPDYIALKTDTYVVHDIRGWNPDTELASWEILPDGVGRGFYTQLETKSDTTLATTAFVQNRLGLTEVTWSELKTLRDSNKLLPNKLYRITDFVTTTSQAGTSSAAHAFDIVVLAISTNKLLEDAKALLHEDDTYFVNSKLESWTIKYCLDNDSNRFNWASSTGKGVIYYMKDEFGNECPYDFKNILFTRRIIASATYNQTELTSGYLAPSTYTPYGLTTGTATKQYYTFNIDETSAIDATLCQYAICSTYSSSYTGYIVPVNNKIAEYFITVNTGGYHTVQSLNSIVLINSKTSSYYPSRENTFDTGCHDITLRTGCYQNIFGKTCYNIILGKSSANNQIDGTCFGITLNNSVTKCKFGTNCNNISLKTGTSNIFEQYCSTMFFYGTTRYCQFGEGCSGFQIRSTNYFENNTFGQGCYSIFVPSGYTNVYVRQSSFGKCAYSIYFYSSITNSDFGSNCNQIYFRVGPETETRYTKIGAGCKIIDIYSGSNGNVVGNGSSNIQFGTSTGKCQYCIIDTGSWNIYLGDACIYNWFGAGTRYINGGSTGVSSTSPIINLNYSRFEPQTYNIAIYSPSASTYLRVDWAHFMGVCYIFLNGTGTTRHCDFLGGVSGDSSSAYKTISPLADGSFYQKDYYLSGYPRRTYAV